MAEALAERERERESTGRERLISATHGRRRRLPARPSAWFPVTRIMTCQTTGQRQQMHEHQPAPDE